MKKEPSARYCRNIRAIAVAFGLAVLKQRHRMKSQLAPVTAATLRPDFPKKQKPGWPRAEVVAWGLQHVQLSKDRRGITIVVAGQPLPDPAHLVSLEEREVILSKLPANYQTRYRELLEMHDHPNPQAGGKSLTEKQHQDLIDIGLVKRGSALLVPVPQGGTAPPIPIPDYCSQSEFAELVSKLYMVPVYPMRISRAVNEQGMAGKMSNQSIKTSLALPWWEENVVRKEQPGQGTLFQQAATAKLQTDIDYARRVKVEADEAERVASDKWIFKADARASISGALKLHHVFVKNNCEKHFKTGVLEKLAALRPPVAADLLAQIGAACVATGKEIVSAIETDCENA
jgi:hypothetical protein